MRAIIFATAITILLTATSAAAVNMPHDDRGTRDECAHNNSKTPFSCITIGTTDSPFVFYLDTGRHDGWSGIWQEDNTYAGLQKTSFYADTAMQIADGALLS